MTLAPKTVDQSCVHDHTYKIFPNDLNSYGTAFGGMIMAIIDRVALVVAERHSEKTCVTVSVDSIHFLNPAKKGDTLIFSAALNRSWNSSMEIGVKVVAENIKTKKKVHILSAYFTFVALDENEKPTPVAQVIPQTSAQKRRFNEAEMRRNHRKIIAQQIKEERAKEIT